MCHLHRGKRNIAAGVLTGECIYMWAGSREIIKSPQTGPALHTFIAGFCKDYVEFDLVTVPVHLGMHGMQWTCECRKREQLLGTGLAKRSFARHHIGT
jgi:hypothetical protein